MRVTSVAGRLPSPWVESAIYLGERMFAYVAQGQQLVSRSWKQCVVEEAGGQGGSRGDFGCAREGDDRQILVRQSGRDNKEDPYKRVKQDAR